MKSEPPTVALEESPVGGSVFYCGFILQLE